MDSAEKKDKVSDGAEGRYDCIKLENQLCFPLYVCSKEIVRRYKPFLDEMGITYTQYITMMVLWERESVNVSQLGECLYLDSGTLTPVLKTLEAKGLVVRKRSAEDERSVIVEATEAGMALREQAVTVPPRMGACVNLSQEDAMELYRILHLLIDNIGK
ncbi:MAG: MarR family transcriptional regulator [Lachnospiraceae bacterium]|nr:MarR family transcriptional regulator [Lachnospiraceae bacterium]